MSYDDVQDALKYNRDIETVERRHAERDMDLLPHPLDCGCRECGEAEYPTTLYRQFFERY